MKNNAKGLTPLYIILVPIILVVVLLNSGLLQKLLPAADVHGETYRVNRYNYYYFTIYNAFLETDYCSATRFLRNSDRILEKKSACS